MDAQPNDCSEVVGSSGVSGVPESEGMGRLVVVSNRVPTGMRSADTGGLATALKGALSSGGLWFGWSGEIAPDEAAAEVVRSRIDGNIVFSVLDLTEQDLEEYYFGYSNRSLWPILHYRIDLADFRREHYAGYLRVNRRFARILAEQVKSNDTIWIHDYHLIPLAQELRRLGLRNKIGFFLHIPWPSPDIWAALPEHRKLLSSFEAYDLIGLQTEFDAENFIQSVAREGLEALIPAEKVAAFPISIETKEFAAVASTAGNHPLARKLATSLRGRKLMIGVDRLDYTKGIGQRMGCFGRFLEMVPAARGKVVYLQVTPKTRSEVPEYMQIQREVAEIAGRINGAYGDIDWVPIWYMNRTIRREALAGLYRLADVGLVTPLRDGMNLVAKEYVAAQDEADPGVLVLSRFAGSSHEMDGALLVNPYDEDETAAAIEKALAMPLDERQARWRGMFERLRTHDVECWRESFLRALEPSRPVLKVAS